MNISLQNTCKAITKKKEYCKNHPMKQSIFCYIHSFGKFKDIKWYKNATYHFFASLLFAIILFLLTMYYGPSLENQEKMLQNADKTNNQLNAINHTLGLKDIRSEIVKKSLREREKELEDSLILLKDASSKVLSGNHNYLKIVSSQLRALLCYKGNVLKPLLLDIAEEKGIELACYARTFGYLENLPGGSDDILSAFNFGVIISSQKNRRDARRYSLKEWLNEPLMKLGREKYTANEIILMVAESEGGVSYSEYLPEKLIKAKKMILTKAGKKYNQIEDILLQTAAVSLDLGKRVLNEKEDRKNRTDSLKAKLQKTNVLYSNKKYKENLQLIEDVLASLSSPKDEVLIAKLVTNKGGCYFSMGIENKSFESLKKAAENYHHALSIWTKIDNLKRSAEIKASLGSIYCNLANFENQADNLKKAIKYWEESLKVLNEESSSDTLTVFNAESSSDISVILRENIARAKSQIAK